jgi:Rps23 Pro-64 3,4-dihydroxylase Tpa1-like proline 4-hydroxylase
MANPLEDLVKQLLSQAQPRPDIITPGSTGQLENARPVTFAGRVVKSSDPVQTLEEILKKPATESPDAEGMGGISEALIKSAPAIQAGVMGQALRKYQTTSFSNRELMNELLSNPKFEKFQGKVQKQLIKNPDDLIDLYRGMSLKELQDYAKYGPSGIRGFSIDPEVALGFAHRTSAQGPSVVLQAKAPREAIFARGSFDPRKTQFSKEKEVFVNMPELFTNPKAQTHIPIQVNALEPGAYARTHTDLLNPQVKAVYNSLLELVNKTTKR